jgi:hypothetical protein
MQPNHLQYSLQKVQKSLTLMIFATVELVCPINSVTTTTTMATILDKSGN